MGIFVFLIITCLTERLVKQNTYTYLTLQHHGFAPEILVAIIH